MTTANGRKRPQRYTKAVHKRIVEAVREGCYMSDAFSYAGIHRATGAEWLRLGRDHPEQHPEYAQLALDVDEAESSFVHEMHGHILAAARSHEPQTWQAAQTILERRFPGKYGRRDTTVIEGGENPLQVKAWAHIQLGDPIVMALSRLTLRRAAGTDGFREMSRAEVHAAIDEAFDQAEAHQARRELEARVPER